MTLGDYKAGPHTMRSMPEDYRLQGTRCDNCGWVSLYSAQRCPKDRTGKYMKKVDFLGLKPGMIKAITVEREPPVDKRKWGSYPTVNVELHGQLVTGRLTDVLVVYDEDSVDPSNKLRQGSYNDLRIIVGETDYDKYQDVKVIPTFRRIGIPDSQGHVFYSNWIYKIDSSGRKFDYPPKEIKLENDQPTRLVGWGSELTGFKTASSNVSRSFTMNKDPLYPEKKLLVKEKGVAWYDEDTITLSVGSAREAIEVACGTGMSPKQVRLATKGSEGHVYAANADINLILEALGAHTNVTGFDNKNACTPAGSAIEFVRLHPKVSLVIGTDNSQAEKYDDLRYTSSAGSFTFLFAPVSEDRAAAQFTGSYAYTKGMLDFWRRPLDPTPKHLGPVTRAYIDHTVNAVKGLMEERGTHPKDYDYVFGHAPNGIFFETACSAMGFEPEQYRVFISNFIKFVGNTYSAQCGLMAIYYFDMLAKEGQRFILFTYGSGAQSVGYEGEVLPGIEEIRERKEQQGIQTIDDRIEERISLTGWQADELQGLTLEA